MGSPGQRVLITGNGGGDAFYRVGDQATLTRFDGADWWARFSDGAEWCIGVENENFTRVGVLGSSLHTPFMPLDQFRAPSIDRQPNAGPAGGSGAATGNPAATSAVATYWWATYVSGAWCVSVESRPLTGTPGTKPTESPVRLREKFLSILARSRQRGSAGTNSPSK